MRNPAVMSLSSMWQIEGNPPYRKQRASRNAPLWRANPVSAIGRVASHLDAPFFDATCIVLFLFTLLTSFSSSCVASEIDFTIENT